VTLLYDERGIAEHAIEPVSWTVREFVLVHSLRGQSKYIPLGRWPLR
jgi:2'-5' RNA ligase